MEEICGVASICISHVPIIYESAEFERPKHVLAKINSSRLSTGSPVEQPHERAKFCCHHGDKHAEKEEEEEKE